MNGINVTDNVGISLDVIASQNEIYAQSYFLSKVRGLHVMDAKTKLAAQSPSEIQEVDTDGCFGFGELCIERIQTGSVPKIAH